MKEAQNARRNNINTCDRWQKMQVILPGVVHTKIIFKGITANSFTDRNLKIKKSNHNVKMHLHFAIIIFINIVPFFHS